MHGCGKSHFVSSQACTLADRHIGQLVYLRLTILEVENHQRFVRLRYAAGVPWGIRVDSVVQSHDGSVVVLFLDSPHQRTLSCAVVCVETFRCVNPLPAQILLKIDVQRAEAAPLLSRSHLAITRIQWSPVSSSCRVDDSFTRNKPDKNIWPWWFFVLVVRHFRCWSAEINGWDIPIFACRRYRACYGQCDTMIHVGIIQPSLNHWSDIERYPLLFTG